MTEKFKVEEVDYLKLNLLEERVQKHTIILEFHKKELEQLKQGLTLKYTENGKYVITSPINDTGECTRRLVTPETE